MKRHRPGLYRAALALVAMLPFGTSCVPVKPSHTVAAVPIRNKAVAQAQTLLRQLDLNVPTEVLRPVAASAAFAQPYATAAALPFLDQARSLDDASRATDCLTAAVYYEARSEPLDGQRAVAQVVLNRVRDRAFPNSVCGVVYQGSERRTGCQFSFTCDGSMTAPLQPEAWDRSRLVAQAALAGNVYAPAGTATHYHAASILPWWAPSLTRIGMIGSQVFYRWHDALDQALANSQGYSGVEPSASAPLVQTAGVTIHDGSLETVAGVTIHRPRAAAADLTAASADATAPVTATAAVVPALPSAPTPRHITVFSGVRIHVGSVAPVDQDEPPAGTDAT